jgi:hypothetical protein
MPLLLGVLWLHLISESHILSLPLSLSLGHRHLTLLRTLGLKIGLKALYSKLHPIHLTLPSSSFGLEQSQIEIIERDNFIVLKGNVGKNRKGFCLIINTANLP